MFLVGVVSYLVDVLCKSAGVLLAGGRAGGAEALLQDPAEAAASLTGVGHDSLSGDLTWLLEHGPRGQRIGEVVLSKMMPNK